MLSQPFFNRFCSTFHQLPIFWQWSQNHFQHWHIFSLYHAYNLKMLSWPFFNWFDSNFHQLPNFWHWSQTAFKTDIFFRFMPIAKNAILAIFQPIWLKFSPASYFLILIAKLLSKVTFFSLFQAYNLKMLIWLKFSPLS